MRYLVIVILIFSLFSCTKIGRNVTVKGVVKNPITGKTYEGLKVHLLVGETFQLPGGYKEIKSTETDQNGRFELSAGRTREVYVQVFDAAGNYRLGWYEDGEYKGTSVKKATKGKTMEVEYHLVPYGEVTLDIQNINCESIEDTMWFRSKTQFEESYPSNWSFPRVGCYSYTSPSPNTNFIIGNRTYQIRVKRSGVETVTEETFFIEENELMVIQLHY